MIWNKIKAALDYSSGKDIYQLINTHNIEIRYDRFESIYAVIAIGNKTIIWIDSRLPYQIKEFVLWHELGHYLIDYKHGVFTFHKYSCKSELPVNIFACLKVGISMQEWIQSGCPKNIAVSVFDYLTQNVYIPETLGE